MPTYPYICSKCETKFDVIKAIARIEESESCGKCGAIAHRGIAHTNFTGGSDWDASYNPAFGCVVKSKRHQREILAKLKGEGREMIEVGNEPIENIVRDSDRVQKENQEKRWTESADKIMSEVL